MTDDDKHPFTCSWAIYGSSLQIQSNPLPLSNWAVFLLLSFKNSLCILDTRPFSDTWWQIFSPILWVAFSLYVLLITKVFNYDQVQLSFFFCCCAFVVMPKKLLPNPKSQKLTPVFSSVSLMVLVLTFGISSTWVSSPWGVRREPHLVILLVHVHLSWHHLLKRLLFLLCLGIPWKTKWPWIT